MAEEIEKIELDLVFDVNSIENTLNQERSPEEFKSFVAFENDELSIEEVTPHYCPNTIE